MNTKNIPSIISLAAGLVALIVTFLRRAELIETLTTLLIVLLSFYILGCIVRAVVDRLTREEAAEEEEETPLENIDTENMESAENKNEAE